MPATRKKRTDCEECVQGARDYLTKAVPRSSRVNDAELFERCVTDCANRAHRYHRMAEAAAG